MAVPVIAQFETKWQTVKMRSIRFSTKRELQCQLRQRQIPRFALQMAHRVAKRLVLHVRVVDLNQMAAGNEVGREFVVA